MKNLSSLIMLTLSIVILCIGCSSDEQGTLPAPEVQKTMVITTGILSDISADLMEFVTAVITYYEEDGVRKLVLSDDKYEKVDREYTMTQFPAYRYRCDSLQICITDSDFIKVEYIPKENVTSDDTRMYEFFKIFGLISYDYVYSFKDENDKDRYFRTFYDSDIKVEPSEDGRYSAEQAKEYIRELCAKPLSIHMHIIPPGGCVQY